MRTGKWHIGIESGDRSGSAAASQMFVQAVSSTVLPTGDTTPCPLPPFRRFGHPFHLLYAATDKQTMEPGEGNRGDGILIGTG